MAHRPPTLPPHRPDTRAVSPVIGVVLMVAITIVLAAAMATFVFGLAPDGQMAPTTSISLEGDAGGDRIVLVHEGGEALELAEFTILVDGDVDAGNESLTGRLETGERQNVTVTASGEIEAILRHDPSGEIVARHTVHVG